MRAQGEWCSSSSSSARSSGSAAKALCVRRVRIAFSTSMTHNGRAIATFKSWDQLEISYQQWGQQRTASPPVVLHHGFVADAESNWVAPGVVEALLAAGRRVIAPDARGHGRSQKPHDPARYGEDRMARDLAVLLDTIDVQQIALVGYSMGAIVSL